MVKHLLASCSLLLLLGVGGLPALAQSTAPSAPAKVAQKTIGEEDLKKFVGVAKKLEMISQERNSQVVQAVEKEGLKMERFREIFTSKQNPKAKPKQEVSKEEEQKYDRVLAQLVQIQKDTQSKMGTAVQSEGLEVPRFLEILETIQKSPDLQKKVDQMLKGAK